MKPVDRIRNLTHVRTVDRIDAHWRVPDGYLASVCSGASVVYGVRFVVLSTVFSGVGGVGGGVGGGGGSSSDSSSSDSGGGGGCSS